MKIEIINEGEYYHLFVADGSIWPLKNFRRNWIHPFAFNDDDICNLIGEKNFDKSFQEGKYIYAVTKKHLQLITGERSAENKTELEMYKD